MNFKCKSIVVCLLVLTAFNASAESAEDLAKQSQNPVGNMYSVPMEYWHHNGIGVDGEGAANMLFLKPVVPVTVGSFNLINRFILPYMGVDPSNGGDFGNVIIKPSDTKESGIGNFQYQAIFSPSEPGPVIYGLGAMFEFPTASDDGPGLDVQRHRSK